MRRVRVKICGITRLEDLHAAVEAGADALGFIIDVPQSPRNLPIDEARKIMKETPIFVERIAVTVFRSIEHTLRICRELRPDAIQIHGEKLDGRWIRKLLDEIPIIRAVNVASEETLKTVSLEAKFFDAILADSHVSGKYGGTGITHDWNLSRKLRELIRPKPLILAGGLRPENVREAILSVRPFAVDVSTGVEKQPGVKDRDKIISFIREVRRAELCLN